MHRLDLQTSGVLVLAKSLPSARRLSGLFKTRAVSKTYLALCHGDPCGGGEPASLLVAACLVWCGVDSRASWLFLVWCGVVWYGEQSMDVRCACPLMVTSHFPSQKQRREQL